MEISDIKQPPALAQLLQYDLISGKVSHVAYQPLYIRSADSKLYTPLDAFFIINMSMMPRTGLQ